MTEAKWQNMNADTGKFLRAENYIVKPFTGLFSAIFVSSTKEKGTSLVSLQFDGDKTLSMFGLDNQRDDSSYPMGLGEFIASAKELGIDVQEANEGDIKGIRLVESATGKELEKDTCNLTVRGIQQSQRGDASQNKDSFWWGKLESYEWTTAQPAKKPGKYPLKPKAPKESAPTQSSNITGAVMELLPASVGEIYEALKKKNIKCLPSDIRAVLEAEGAKDRGDNKYQVV